jgi:hypothetical protein
VEIKYKVTGKDVATMYSKKNIYILSFTFCLLSCTIIDVHLFKKIQ